MNFSRNKILSNLGHKPWNANVRWIEEDPDPLPISNKELLRLYVKNSDHKKYNKYLRADSHEAGMIELINEGAFVPGASIFDINTSVLSEEKIEKAIKNLPHHEALKKQLLNETLENSSFKETQQNVNEDLVFPGFIPYQFKTDQLELSNIAKQLLKDFFPHKVEINSYPNANDWDVAMADNPRQMLLTALDDEILIANPEALQAQRQITTDLKANLLSSENQQMLMEEYISKIPQIENVLRAQPTYTDAINKRKDLSGIEPQPLSRGLYFQTKQEQQDFMAQLASNKTVRWDAFTSATSNPDVATSYSNLGNKQYPVKLKFQEGNYGSNNAIVFDGNNLDAQEYIYPPGTYFTASNITEIDSLPVITVEATKQHPRVASMLSRLKPSFRSF